MPSQIVSSLLAALHATTFSYSVDSTLLGAAPVADPVASLYPASIRAGLLADGAAAADAFASNGGSTWASHVVPSVNLFLALLVFLFLVEERCTAEVISWFDDLTAGRYSLSAGLPTDSKTADARAGGMGRRERLALASATCGIMGSMLFLSNSVFDDFASATLRIGAAAHEAGPLLDVAARFSSFSILVLFLGLALALVFLTPKPQPTLPPLLFILPPVLLASTVLSRFSLALHTALAWNMTAAHLALLVLEPAGLLACIGWMLYGSGSSSSSARGRPFLTPDDERSLGLYGSSEKRSPVLIVVTQHD